jgi:hypothetical protein
VVAACAQVQALAAATKTVPTALSQASVAIDAAAAQTQAAHIQGTCVWRLSRHGVRLSIRDGAGAERSAWETATTLSATAWTPPPFVSTSRSLDKWQPAAAEVRGDLCDTNGLGGLGHSHTDVCCVGQVEAVVAEGVAVLHSARALLHPGAPSLVCCGRGSAHVAAADSLTCR